MYYNIWELESLTWKKIQCLKLVISLLQLTFKFGHRSEIQKVSNPWNENKFLIKQHHKHWWWNEILVETNTYNVTKEH